MTHSRRVRILLITVLMSMVLSACATNEDDIGSLHIVLDDTVQLSPALTQRALVVILDGTFTVPANTVLRGDIFVLNGNVVIKGDFDGQLLLLGGRVTTGDTAQLRGDIRLVSGEFTPSPDTLITATVQRGDVDIPAPRITTGTVWLDDVLWFSLQTIPLIILAIVYLTRWHTSLTHIENTMTRYGVVAAAVGLLSGVVLLSLIVLMAYTIVLLPVALLLVMGFFVMIGISILAWGDILIQAIADYFAVQISTAGRAIIGVVLMMLLIELSQYLPLMDIAVIVIISTGVGALLLTRFGWQSFERQP